MLRGHGKLWNAFVWKGLAAVPANDTPGHFKAACEAPLNTACVCEAAPQTAAAGEERSVASVWVAPAAAFMTPRFTVAQYTFFLFAWAARLPPPQPRRPPRKQYATRHICAHAREK